MAEGVTITWK